MEREMSEEEILRAWHALDEIGDTDRWTGYQFYAAGYRAAPGVAFSDASSDTAKAELSFSEARVEAMARGWHPPPADPPERPSVREWRVVYTTENGRELPPWKAESLDDARWIVASLREGSARIECRDATPCTRDSTATRSC
jgi:hypothetical protein